MNKEIPYYTLDEDGNSQYGSSGGEAYIDDDELKDLLIDFLGDSVSEEEIKKFSMPLRMKISLKRILIS